MGCAQSSGELNDAANGRAAAPPANPARQSRAALGPARVAPAAAKFETNSMATYSTGGGAGDLYGLFAKNAGDQMATKEELDRGSHSRVTLAVCPEDDGFHDAATEGLLVTRGVAMTVPYTVLIGEAGEQHRTQIEQAIDVVFDLVNRHFNNWNEKSNITNISNLQGGKSLPVPSELQNLFEIVDRVFRMTDGLFDPTISSVLATSRTFLVKQGKPSSPKDLEHLKHAVGWDKRVKFSLKKDKITILNSNTGIELGGIAKGHAVDMLVDALAHCGFSNVYVDWGADIRASGHHPDGRPWRTALVDAPELSKIFRLWKEDRLVEAVDSDHALYLADLENVAVATSGDYFQIEKFGFHHIVHPHELVLMRAGQKSLGSVSIFAETCAIADGVATAAMTLPSAKAAAAWLKRLEANGEITGYCVIGRDGTQIHETSPPLVSIQQSCSDSGSMTNEEISKSSADVTYADLGPWLAALPRVDAVASIDGDYGMYVDSIATLSIDPPMVSVALRTAAVKVGAKLKLVYLNGSDLDVREKLSKGTYMFQLDKAFISGRTHLETVVKNVAVCESMCIVSALVTNVRPQQTTQSVTVGGQVVVMPLPPIPTELSMNARLRAVMRRNPSPVCIVTVQSDEGSTYGMTATSVRLGDADHSMVTFNAQKDGLFYMAMSGSTNRVCLNFPLEVGSGSSIAGRFTGIAALSEEEVASLVVEDGRGLAMLKDCMVLECHMRGELDGGDHGLMMATVTGMRGGRTGGAMCQCLLSRKDGKYLQLLGGGR